MKTKICTKCKIEKDISEFSKNKNKKDGLTIWCKSCYKQYYKDNCEKIIKQRKQYYKDNREKITKQHKQYYKNNSEKMIKQQRQYCKNNVEKIKQYCKDNAEKIAKQRKQYCKDNTEKIAKQRKQYYKNNALFETYSKQLEIFEEIRYCPKNNKLLEVKCAYCGRWFQPTNLQVRNRLQAFKGNYFGEHRFYCSENCKIACPIYNQNKWPKGFKKATSREVVPLLRQLVLKRDNYTCQMCGATIETAELHVHHIISYMLNKMLANDPDSCITLCKECHKRVHSQKGCRYIDLRCKGK